MSLSPVQFAAMRDRLEALDRPRGRMLEILIAQLTAVVGNTSFRSFAEPQTTQSFMLTRLPEAKPERKSRRTSGVMEEAAENWREGFGKLMEKQSRN